MVTYTLPDEPVSTTALICVAESIVNDLALTSPNFTLVVPEKFVPLIVTVVPLMADAGVNEVIVGG